VAKSFGASCPVPHASALTYCPSRSGKEKLQTEPGGSSIGHGQTTITVVVKQPEVEHKVRMRDFEAWLESNARSPAEMALKSRLRQLLGT
jgi:hypothetical protein